MGVGEELNGNSRCNYRRGPQTAMALFSLAVKVRLVMLHALSTNSLEWASPELRRPRPCDMLDI